MCRIGDAEVVRGAEPELGIDAGAAPRVEELLLGCLEVALREQRDAGGVLLARGAVLAFGARPERGEREHEDQHAHHRSLRSAPAAPSHSAASRHTSAASTSHGYRSAGIWRTEDSAAARTIGWTWLAMIESRS